MCRYAAPSSMTQQACAANSSCAQYQLKRASLPDMHINWPVSLCIPAHGSLNAYQQVMCAPACYQLGYVQYKSFTRSCKNMSALQVAPYAFASTSVCCQASLLFKVPELLAVGPLPCWSRPPCHGLPRQGNQGLCNYRCCPTPDEPRHISPDVSTSVCAAGRAGPGNQHTEAGPTAWAPPAQRRCACLKNAVLWLSNRCKPHATLCLCCTAGHAGQGSCRWTRRCIQAAGRPR